MFNPPLKYHRQNEGGEKKSGEECFDCLLVEEDLLLLASKTQSLSWLDTSQPAIAIREENYKTKAFSERIQ